MATDLHTYLDGLRSRYPDEVVEIDQEVDARYEATALLLKLHKLYLKELPILLFNRVRKVNGELSPDPVMLNVWGSRRRFARELGCSTEEVTAAIQDRVAHRRQQPIRVDRSEAPVKQVVQTGSQINLQDLPALVSWRLDPGPYVNSGAFLCYDPETGIDNSGILRGWLKNRDEIPWYGHAHGHSDIIYQKHEQLGRDMKAAFWVGHHPIAMKGASLHIPYGVSHWEAMGALIDEPIHLVASETLGEDFLVPADAEYVIEGIVPVGERSPEGPYGEDWGHTGAQRLSPVLKVTAITRRSNPIWINFITSQSPFLIDRREASFRVDPVLRAARLVSPNVLAVRESAIKGGFYVKLRRGRDGEAKDVGLAAVAAVEGAKFVFVVEEDVDIDNDFEALWALGSRTQWDRDVVIIPGARGAGTDPSTPQDGVTAKVVIDATRSGASEPRNDLPPGVLDRVSLRGLLPASFFDSLSSRLLDELEID
jgi:UbiD family decarboxylase